MNVTIETKSRPCPGVERAVLMAEDALGHRKKVFCLGELIHNKREIARLVELGLQPITIADLEDPHARDRFAGGYLLVRAHGERREVIEKAVNAGLQILDATCPIVAHSHGLVSDHLKEGWRILIVGKKDHPEVQALLSLTEGKGLVLSSPEEAQRGEFEERSLVIAQTTVDPDLFHAVCKVVSSKVRELKIANTTCRFLRTRQQEVEAFAEEMDVVVVVGGKNSSNLRLLYDTVRTKKRAYWVEDPAEVDPGWFTDGERVGILGGASTPRWQLEELRSLLETIDPKGSKHRKGGFFLWRMREKPH